MRVIDDQTVRGAESLKLVGRGNRFRRTDALPEGVGRLVDTPEESDRGPLSE
jgi:hypothetical protein